MTDTLGPQHNIEFMGALLDTLIPPSHDGRMPGAGTIGIEGAIAAAIGADPRSRGLIEAGLAAVVAAAPPGRAGPEGRFAGLSAVERATAVSHAAAGHAGFLELLLRHVYLAYYQHPAVLAALGEPPRPPFPDGFTLAPTDPDLLESLRRRSRTPG